MQIYQNFFSGGSLLPGHTVRFDRAKLSGPVPVTGFAVQFSTMKSVGNYPHRKRIVQIPDIRSKPIVITRAYKTSMYIPYI